MVSGAGMSSSCFFLAALLCALYYFFALPLPSSFHLGGRGRTAVGEWRAAAHSMGHAPVPGREPPQLSMRASPALSMRASPALPNRHAGGAKPKTHTLQDTADGFTAFLLVVGLPAGVYVATHLAVLLQWVHIWSLALLVSGPLVFVCSLKGALAGGRGWRLAWMAAPRCMLPDWFCPPFVASRMRPGASA